MIPGVCVKKEMPLYPKFRAFIRTSKKDSDTAFNPQKDQITQIRAPAPQLFSVEYRINIKLPVHLIWLP